MNSVAVRCFGFEDHLVRVVMRDGEPWFVAMDVCRAIGIRNWKDSVERLDEDEKGVGNSDLLGGGQAVLIVSESGLYTIILRSHAAITPGTAAHRFRKWVTAEVLPQIRRTGAYAPEVADGESGDGLSTIAEDRLKLDKIHYVLRGFGPAAMRAMRAMRAMWKRLDLEWVPEMDGPGNMGADIDAASDAGVSAFMTARLEKAPGLVVAGSVLYRCYVEFCRASDLRPASPKLFSQLVVRYGLTRRKSSSMYYVDIRLKSAEETAEA